MVSIGKSVRKDKLTYMTGIDVKTAFLSKQLNQKEKNIISEIIDTYGLGDEV